MNFRQIRRASLVAVGGLLAVAALVSAQVEVPTPAVRRMNSQTLEEIQRQRAQFGSPIAGSSFDDAAGTSDDAASAAEFADAYQRIASERRAETTPFVDTREYLPTPDPRGRCAAALREAARVLETAAADLEDAEAFSEADALRKRARQLRLEARPTPSASAGENLEK